MPLDSQLGRHVQVCQSGTSDKHEQARYDEDGGDEDDRTEANDEGRSIFGQGLELVSKGAVN